ncbi:unnamed protein product [Linum tenue]|uniref:Uncharacterized protein n=1 Tax=Linum tenue TaxID=586396 RepID=A0AAV0MJX0_9ROSI|nr:unnamed protein product [Linum tenue]
MQVLMTSRIFLCVKNPTRILMRQMRRKIMTAAKKTRRKIKLYRCPKISIAQLNDFETMEAHTVEEDPEEYFCGHYKTTSSIAKANN